MSTTAFTSLPTAEQISCRLVVRRIRPAAAHLGRAVQGELFADWRHHAFVTNSTLDIVEADARHRDHAIVEQVIADLEDGSLGHLPSGSVARWPRRDRLGPRCGWPRVGVR